MISSSGNECWHFPFRLANQDVFFDIVKFSALSLWNHTVRYDVKHITEDTRTETRIQTEKKTFVKNIV